MEPTIVISGAHIHVGFVVMNCLWVLLSLILGGVLLTQVHRIVVLSTSARNPRQFHGLRVQWAHATCVWLCVLIAGIDVSHVYFDEALYIGIVFGTLSYICTCK